jgi:hypothetical protein
MMRHSEAEFKRIGAGRYGDLLDELEHPSADGVSFETMSASIENLAEQAMSLSVEARARLADLLVESLDTDELGRIERLWISEAKRRRDEVREGKVETIPGAEGLRRVRDTLKR